MRVVYGISLAVGAVALLAWLAALAVSTNVAGWEKYDPDIRFTRTGRRTVGAVFGLGMAGLSASYAGWSSVLALGAAIGGAVLGAVLVGSSE